MRIFNSLSDLERFFMEEQIRKKGFVEVYETAPEWPRILERLYFMLTVGSAFVKKKSVTAIEVMKDLLELVKRIQNPIRGLFLRYYMLKRFKDIMPEELKGNEG